MKIGAVKSRGRKSLGSEEQRKRKAEELITSQLVSGPKRWTDLLSKAADTIPSKKYLWRMLGSLESQEIIRKRKISHKNVQYLLSKDYNTLLELIDYKKQTQEIHSELIEYIENMKKLRLTEVQISLFIAINIYQRIVNLTLAIHEYTKTGQRFREHFGELIKNLLERMQELIYSSSKAFPKQSDDALSVLIYLIVGDMYALERKIFPPKMISFGPNIEERLVAGKNIIKKIKFKTLHE